MTIVQAGIALLIACGVVWHQLRASRRTASSKSSPPVEEHRSGDTQPVRLYPVVDCRQAQVEPYPFVFVQTDETVRELHQSEREYLETPFHPADGGRPYVKSNYEQTNGWGNIEGFLERVEVPPNIQIQPAPSTNPITPMTKEALKQLMLERGFDVTVSASGSMHARRSKQDSKPAD